MSSWASIARYFCLQKQARANRPPGRSAFLCRFECVGSHFLNIWKSLFERDKHHPFVSQLVVITLRIN